MLSHCDIGASLGLTYDINSMPKLLYTWYFEKFTALVTSIGHSVLRREVSRMFTILINDVNCEHKIIYECHAFYVFYCLQTLAESTNNLSLNI